MIANVEIWFPMGPGVFAVFAGIMVAAAAYYVVKFVVSIWTGA